MRKNVLSIVWSKRMNEYSAFIGYRYEGAYKLSIQLSDEFPEAEKEYDCNWAIAIN